MGFFLVLIPPHMRKKEELSTAEKVKGLAIFQEVESRKKISKVTSQIIIIVHIIQVKKIKVQNVGQPHVLGFL